MDTCVLAVTNPQSRFTYPLYCMAFKRSDKINTRGSSAKCALIAESASISLSCAHVTCGISATARSLVLRMCRTSDTNAFSAASLSLAWLSTSGLTFRPTVCFSFHPVGSGSSSAAIVNAGSHHMRTFMPASRMACAVMDSRATTRSYAFKSFRHSPSKHSGFTEHPQSTSGLPALRNLPLMTRICSCGA